MDCGAHKNKKCPDCGDCIVCWEERASKTIIFKNFKHICQHKMYPYNTREVVMKYNRYKSKKP